MNYTFSNKVSELSGSAIRATFKILSQPGIISFAGGMPAPELFPTQELADIAQKILLDNGKIALQYGITEGYAPLLDQVTTRLKSRDIAKETDEILITSGGQQAIDLTAKIFLNEGDGVACENPSFIGALNAFRSYGANLYGVEMAEDGLNLEALEQTLYDKSKRIKIIYTIPTFQNPTGITMSLKKRKKLLEIAQKYDVIILEDDPYSELRFKGDHIPSLKQLDDSGRVLYAGSFSKILSPGLRIGYLCGKPEAVQKAAVCKQVVDVHTSVLPQMIASDFLNSYNIDEHIAKMSAFYGEKCALMRDCITRYFPPNITTTDPDGGLFLWCTPDSATTASSTDIANAAVAQKIAIVPGHTLMPDPSVKTGAFRLNYSTPTPEQIETGIKTLGEVLKNYV